MASLNFLTSKLANFFKQRNVWYRIGKCQKYVPRSNDYDPALIDKLVNKYKKLIIDATTFNTATTSQKYVL